MAKKKLKTYAAVFRVPATKKIKEYEAKALIDAYSISEAQEEALSLARKKGMSLISVKLAYAL